MNQAAKHLSPRHITLCISAGFRVLSNQGGKSFISDERLKLCHEARLDFLYLKVKYLLIPESDQKIFRICPSFLPGKWKNKSIEEA